MRRLKEYKKISRLERQHKIKNSFEKHGIENHTFDIIEECKMEDLNHRERYWQDFYDVLHKGLNCILTKTDILPKVISDETKRRLSEANKGNKLTHEQIVKMKRSKNESILNKRVRHNNAILLLDTSTGIYFECLRDASDALCINYSTLRNMLNKTNNYKNKINLIRV